MSLKSRLQNNRRSKQISSAFTDVDLIDFLEENKDINKLIIYSYNKIYTEKNRESVSSEVTFSSEASYRKEIIRIAELYENVPSYENPCSEINISDEINIKIIIPPLVSEGIHTVISRNSRQNRIPFEQSLSNEIYTYLQECVKQNLNIFITGSANINKNDVMQFLLSLYDNNNKIIMLGQNISIPIEKPYCVKINDLNSNINVFSFDNVFANEVSTQELISIFELIISGYKGFIVSMSLKDKTDILEAIRNKILLKSPNLFEENADFMSGSSIDVILTLGFDSNENVRITKISEISDGAKNYAIKDIFSLNSDGQYISAGNRSRFFNKTNSPEQFSDSYLKHEYIHSPITVEQAEFDKEIIQGNTEEEEKPLSKLEKLKIKIKQNKKQKKQIINFEEFEEKSPIEEKISETSSDNKIFSENHIEQTEVPDFIQSFEIQKRNILADKQENIIFEQENQGYENISSNEGILASETDNFQDEEPVIRPEIMNILENKEEEIVEEPELFSEIKDIKINNDNYDFDIQDENI